MRGSVLTFRREDVFRGACGRVGDGMSTGAVRKESFVVVRLSMSRRLR